MIISGIFDPISQKELQKLLQIRRENHLSELYVSVCGEGVLAPEERRRLLAMALKPYRHIHVTDEAGEQLESIDEDRIRQGEFRLAAKGIRKELIAKNHYLDVIVDAMCKPSRAAHSRRVAQVCRELAHVHYLDEAKAYRMGMLHDITKKWSDEEGEKVLKVHDPGQLSLSPKVWHSFTAVYWLKENMGLQDPTVLNAIYHHTLGDGRTLYDHILYIADKIEPGRGYDVSRQRRAAEENLITAAAMILAESNEYRSKKEGIHV